jgi:hypothetical protein
MATKKKRVDAGAEYAKAHGLKYGAPDPKVNKGVIIQESSPNKKRAKKK